MITQTQVQLVMDGAGTCAQCPAGGAADERSLDDRLRAIETRLIVSALRLANGNRSKAAQQLKIKRSTLGDRIRKLGLAHDRFERA